MQEATPWVDLRRALLARKRSKIMDTGSRERPFSAKRIKLMDTGSKERTFSAKRVQTMDTVSRARRHF